jgi:hypothetical protein
MPYGLARFCLKERYGEAKCRMQFKPRQFRSAKGNEGKNMNSKFDELTKQMAQSATRRSALKKFGFGLAGMALAMLGIGTARGEPKDRYTCCLYKCGGFFPVFKTVCQAAGGCAPPAAGCVFSRATTGKCSFMCGSI